VTTGHQLARALRAAYLTLHRRTDGCFAADGVTADQFVLLASLADEGAATQQQLVRRVASDPNTVRAMLLLLEGRGLVARGPHPDDGRARRVTLTAKGRRTFGRLWAKSESIRRRLLTALRPGEVADLVALLQRVTDEMSPPKARKRTNHIEGVLPCRD